jgi:hypothetical protein
MHEFRLAATSNKIWNQIELVDFLSKNQNQHIVIRMDPEAICLNNLKLYKILDCFRFSRVDIHTENPLEEHSQYNIIINKQNPWLLKKEHVATDLHVWSREKIFFCLFGRPTASKLGLCSYLLEHYKHLSHLHFSADLSDNNIIQFELDKLLEYHYSSILTAGNLIRHLPLLLSAKDGYTAFEGYYFDDPLTDFYKDILVDIVSESHATGNTFYPTEKTTRPIWMKKPFVVFASKNYLDHLHQLGFKTFCDFWPENYDGFADRERYVRILSLIDFIASKSIKELEQMYVDMQSILQHNYELLCEQKYNVNNIEKINDPE